MGIAVPKSMGKACNTPYAGTDFRKIKLTRQPVRASTASQQASFVQLIAHYEPQGLLTQLRKRRAELQDFMRETLVPNTLKGLS